MTNSLKWINRVARLLMLTALAAVPTLCVAAAEPSSGQFSDRASGGAQSVTADSGLYLKVQLASALKIATLKSGDVVEGSLRRDVYSGDRKLFPAGSRVRLTVDHLEKRARARNDHWPWVVNVFTPRHESFPVFKTATVALPEGESSLQVSLLSTSRMREVYAKGKTSKAPSPSEEDRGAVEVSRSHAKKLTTPTMVLEAVGVGDLSSRSEDNQESLAERIAPTPETLPAGTQCKILLLSDVSASKSNPGDVVRARLLEPVIQNSKLVLPAGSLFEGKVVRKTPPRWLSRAGSLYLTFTEVTPPDGNRVPITASLAGAEIDEKSHTRMDAEGRLRGEHPGKAWMAINLGTTVGITKVADDGLQLVIEAIVSTATDVSTAGTGRIVAGCASGLFMITRHGRDVMLPRFTEMSISLDRPVSLMLALQSERVGIAAGGN